MEIVMLKIFLFIVLAITCILFFYYLRKEKIVSSKLKEAYISLEQGAIEREREARKNILIRSKSVDTKRGIRKYIESANRLYNYSGLGRIFKGLTFELWSVLVVASTAVLYFIVIAITKNVETALLLITSYIAVIVGIQKVLALRNYKLVDENLTEFLNILQNYNATNAEIISILLQVSRYVPEPLKTVMEECYDDAQVSGDRTAALYAMADKIEHPKFKDIIYDIEISLDYCANYKEIINQSRKIMRDEQRAKAERKNLVNELSITMLIMGALFIWAFSIVDGLLTTSSMWDILLYTPVGRICIAIIVIIYIFFCYKMASMER